MNATFSLSEDFFTNVLPIIASSPCMNVSVLELMNKTSKASKNGYFLVVDCRSQSEYDSGRLPDVTHLNSEIVKN